MTALSWRWQRDKEDVFVPLCTHNCPSHAGTIASNCGFEVHVHAHKTAYRPNSQEPWCEVTNGLGGMSGSLVNIREGIWHKQTQTVMAHSFQYKVLVKGSYIHYPPDSLCGVSFTVFGSAAGSSGVAQTTTPVDRVLTIWPTIADQSAHVLTSSSEKHSELQILNFLGVVMYHQTVLPDSSELTINTSEFPEGFYICRMISTDGTETAKFIVRH